MQKKSKNKCKIIPPKNVFKNIPKVPKGQRHPPSRNKKTTAKPANSKKKPGNSKKKQPVPPKRKRPTHNYTEEDAKNALDEYYET